ncbi:nuclear pore protein NSP1 [Emericellopsis cladophorae]|uniref:Nucleoporin NSP1 n=1 Tax=Emericellopsis cladophorae TaxID=2686198 RepID=A0A9P9XXE6_9HYPO|nr:nuclear pore protein NSP1 [Emericellopsis cladophorae]KAI6779608.1 nuclear pore protein NSP1 [Emericellopsis cladophorae]
MFGQQTSGASSNNTTSTAPAASPFGATSGTPSFSFGKPASTPGTSAPSSGGLFGGASSTTTGSGGGLFGNNTTATTSAPSAGVFGGGGSTGNTSSTAPASGGLFENSSSAGNKPASSNLFGGGASSSTPSSGGLFGNAQGSTGANAPASSTPASAAPKFGGFGNATSGSSGNLFGGNKTSNDGHTGDAATTPAKPLFSLGGSTTPAGLPPMGQSKDSGAAPAPSLFACGCCYYGPISVRRETIRTIVRRWLRLYSRKLVYNCCSTRCDFRVALAVRRRSSIKTCWSSFYPVHCGSSYDQFCSESLRCEAGGSDAGHIVSRNPKSLRGETCGHHVCFVNDNINRRCHWPQLVWSETCGGHISNRLFGAAKPAETSTGTEVGKDPASNLFGAAKPAESAGDKSKDAAGADASKSSTTALGASTAGPPPQIATLKNKTMEDIVTRWANDLNKYKKEFKEQATTVSSWDRQLVDNGEKIQKLYLDTYEAERASHEIERQLAAVESQQDELEKWLDHYEGDVQDMFSKQVGPGEQLGGPDQERERTYKLAEKLTQQLDEKSRDLTKMVTEINDISGTLNKSSKPEDPLSQIVRVLNGHLTQLQWIDENASSLQSKVASAQKSTSNMGNHYGVGDSDAAESFYRSYMGRR